MLKELRASKIEKQVAMHEADKQPDAPPAEEPPKDNRDKFSRFDPSSGNQAKKTPKHPMGDSVPSKAAYELLRQRYEAKKFFARELAPWAHCVHRLRFCRMLVCGRFRV